MSKHDKGTSVLSKDNPLFKRALKKLPESNNATTHIRGKREVLLVIRGMVEKLIMQEGIIYELGRFDFTQPGDYHIDLTPYGASDRGVSRVHAQLYMLQDQIFIVDIESTNGTFLGGERLEANDPTLLRKGDELLLGRLGIQVMYR